MKLFYRCTRKLFKIYFKIFYKHQVFGLENVIQGRGILAPNHTSFFDPPIVGVSWPEEISFLARKTLFVYPFFGKLISKLNAFPVSNSHQDLASLKLICQLLKEEKKVVIFPEGMRSQDGHLRPIKQGIGMLAIRAQSPIIPVYIHGCYAIWNRSSRIPKLSGKTACIFGAPINWRDYNHLDKKESQEAISKQVTESIIRLKTWYENGTIGLPP